MPKTKALPKPRDAAWAPNSAPQEAFLACGAYETCYGGAAGGGKSEGLIAEAARYVDHSLYRAVLFRRTFPDLQRSLIQRSERIYPALGGRYHRTDHVWTFPSGAQVLFAHMANDAAALDHKSAEYQFVGFDELTSFTRFQYTYLLSRLRSSDGLPVRARSATNPGDIGHEWVLQRWAPWLDTRPEYKGPRAAPGEVLHYLPGNEEEGDTYVARKTPGALSRAFFPAKATDNPDLMRNDPGYVGRLDALDRVSRAQLKEGDWIVKPGKGMYFQRSWWRFLDEAPPRASWRKAVRAWDLAGSKTGDWTVGVLYVHVPTALTPWVIVDVIRFRGTPGEVEARVKETAEMDGHEVEVLIPQDPGQAGKYQADSYVRVLPGYIVHTHRPTGDKVTRAKPHSPQVEHGLVAMVRAAWNAVVIEEHQDLPDGGFDDCVDATSDGFNHLAGVVPASFEEWAGDVAHPSPRDVLGLPRQRDEDLDEDDPWAALSGRSESRAL